MQTSGSKNVLEGKIHVMAERQQAAGWGSFKK
jgi:hypothetical protein